MLCCGDCGPEDVKEEDEGDEVDEDGDNAGDVVGSVKDGFDFFNVRRSV